MKQILFAALLGSLLAVGCSSGTNGEAQVTKPESVPSAPAGKSAAAPVAYRNPEGKLLCPVMNVVIESEKDAVDFQDHEGKRYYFCCDGCPGKFRKEPAKYAAK